MSITNEPMARDLEQRLMNSSSFIVSSTSSKPVKRNPPAPFVTSTLQQEAARRLGFSASKTMSVAQALYEGEGSGEAGGRV